MHQNFDTPSYQTVAFGVWDCIAPRSGGAVWDVGVAGDAVGVGWVGVDWDGVGAGLGTEGIKPAEYFKAADFAAWSFSRRIAARSRARRERSAARSISGFII